MSLLVTPEYHTIVIPYNLKITRVQAHTPKQTADERSQQVSNGVITVHHKLAVSRQHHLTKNGKSEVIRNAAGHTHQSEHSPFSVLTRQAFKRKHLYQLGLALNSYRLGEELQFSSFSDII